ncbi:microtubule-actin cross-linking factor 1 isoform X6 [Centruroides vittatus]|uniref:microtubule-actin cross-linking factor 1 isoform X6 n=1 Tax=Centruroides vittatus TaxID=120091 RepID=UPI00350F1787
MNSSEWNKITMMMNNHLSNENNINHNEDRLNDPSLHQYESTLYKFKDERDAIQKKTFTKWVNKHLKKANKYVVDLFEDLRDGHNLISLLEVLSGELLPRERGKMRFHMLQNVQIALDFLRYRKIKLVNIRADDIVDGNPKLTLGLIWTIILHFQISDIITGHTDDNLSAREALLRWAQRTTDRYPGVKVTDFTSSWRDGLAFNAIIHRNRPDLIDFRSLRNRTARENLETSFYIAEKEFGVTRLLDPEDVDTPEPDEKSLITYISSLYDVFPEPPAYHPFADDEKLRRVEEYKELSSSLYLWMRESISILQDRNFPNNLVEVKALLSECNRFRVEDVPPRLQDKQRLSHMNRELQKLFRESGAVDIEVELQYDTIERQWNRLMLALQERDQAIHIEINRLEKLQRLAEKVHREAKQCDNKLDDVEKKIAEEEKRIQRLHPMDSKHNCDQIESNLKHIEDNIKSMFRDVQTLKDGKYHQAPELQRRVQIIHERWVNIQLNFQSRLLNVLATRSFVTEERKVTKQRHIVTEQRLVETNKSFQFLQECIDWVNNKLKGLEEADYGNDLPSVQTFLEQHQIDHRTIDQFQKNIDKCVSQKNHFKGEEYELYCRLLGRLEKGYSELLVMSNKRLSDLETLVDFIQSATNELIWMNEKEETEVSRDWSSKNLNLVEVEQYHKLLTSDMERREIQFNSVQDRGESLILQHHPATKCIEAYLAAMQTQWSWLLQLIRCLEVHLDHASNYHQFFREAKECEQWLNQIEDKLKTTFSKQIFNIDEGERLIKEMHELRNNISRYGDVVSALIEQSKHIVPLKQRRYPLPRPLRITAICTYKQLNMVITKDELCWLHDNSQKIKWKINNSSGAEGMVPSVCFVIPPPNQEALDLAESLKRHYDIVVSLWTTKQHKLRQNMIFATIKIVKSWDLAQFRSMGKHQRESILKALNEDTEKLVSEGDQDDPALLRLQEEMRYCNKLFLELQKQLELEEAEMSPKGPVRRFNDMVASMQNILNEKERTLNSRVHSPIPRTLDMLETMVIQHKEFETELHNLESQIQEIQQTFHSITRKSPVLQTRHDTMVESWDRLWSISRVYIERLKSVEISLHGMEESTQVVSNVELQLASYENMPSDLDTLRKVHDNLLNIQVEIQQHQYTLDQLTESTTKVRHLTEQSRPKQTIHHDVNKLDEDVRKLTKRWENTCTQVVERLRSCEAASELLRTYKSKMEVEKVWANEMSFKIEEIKPVKHPVVDAEKEMEKLMTFYNSLAEKKNSIENVNILGGRYIREAKIFDLRLKHYKEGLEEVHPSLDASVVKKAKLSSGADVVSQELDTLNQQYTNMVDSLVQHINELKVAISNHNDQKIAVEEKYKLCGDSISRLFSWVENTELQLADLGLVKETTEELHHQINNAKALRDDIEEHQKPILICLDQVSQVIEQGQELLSKEEIYQLQKDSDLLKRRYDALCIQSEKLLRRLSAALDELHKFSAELHSFSIWLTEANTLLIDNERSLGDLQHLRHNANAYKTFASDVIAHQADLRFITMAAQKFLDESKDYLRGLNDFRINLPHRLHHIEPIESDIKMKVQDITTTYHNLLNRVNKLSDKFAGLTSKQFHYLECSEKAINWLSDVQKTARTLLEEPVAAEPKAVQDQVDRLKALSTDVIGQARLIENTKQASKVLLDSLEGVSVNYSDKKAIEDTVSNLEKGYSQLMSAINDKSNELQTALVHSQDVQDGLDRILRWLDEAENIQRNQSKSISLVREKLDDQIQDHRMLQTDIDRHKPTIDALNVSSQDLLNNSNSRLAKKVEMKMKDVNSRFEKLCDKSRKRGEILDEVSSSLETFEMKVFKFEEWLCSMMSFIDGRDITHRSVDSFERIIEDVMNQRNSKINEYEETVKMGKTLLAKIDVTDTSYVRDKLKHLEQQWKELSDALLDKQKLEKARLEQLSAYEALRAKVIEWLSNMEARVENLEPVAMDKDTLRKQALEIKPLIKEHAEYASTIDKVNQLGNAYDSIMRADSPHRARSPTKKQSPSPSSPTRRSPSRIWRSPDSKTIATTPLSSGSSGFGSRPNSVDNLGNLEDLTPIQQQLSEINHRYSLLGVKLSDRHQEVTDVTEEIRIHLDMLKALLSFIQAKEKQIPKDMLPLSRDLAERQMVELKIIQEEIQEKQHDMDRVKNQANDLLRKKPNALGASNLQQEVNELGSKWSQIQSLIKNKLNFLQELKEFQETNDLLINWLSQKEKMFHVLGPIASDPRMVTSQMQQVQVMRDEFISQQPLLNRFKKSGQNILKSIDSISPGYKKIKEQMDSVQSQWDDLINRLNNRERSLDAASGATKNFHDNLNKLQDSLQQISDKFDMLSETGSDSGEQLEKLKNLEDDLDKQRPLLADAESVCEQLCDILSDSASKNEITTKLNSLEKQYNNLSRKITNRKAELESSLREDKEFFISCDHIQVWLKEKENILNQNFQISADETILKHQVQEFEVTYKEVLNKEHEVHLMLSRGADMMNKMNRKSDTLQLQNKLDSIKHQWDKIRKSATDRHTRLQHCSENCRKYYAALKVFIPWLQQSEDKLNSLKPISFKRVELDKQIKEIQAFKNDISKHSQEFDSLYHFGESVISCCDIDKEPVREGINQIKKRWDRMNQGIYERAQSLDDISQNLVDYQEKARDVQHALQRLEDKLASHDGLGGASRDPKLLDRIKTMLSDANALKKQLDQLHVYADKLISNAKSKSDTSHILDEIEALEKRHRKLTQNLENRCDDLKSASEIVSHFTDKVKSVQHDLSDIEEKLDNMSPIARDIRAVTAQINEMKDFFRILGKIEEDFVDAEHQGHTIVSQGFVPDPKGCKDQLANLQRQLKRINERAKTRQNNLETMSKRLEQFYKNYNETTQNLNDAIHKEKSFSAVGGEIEMVKIQQEEFKIFQGYCMDEFNREVDEINQTGQSLIQSAAPGVKTNNLEQDLEKLNDKWNSLKEKLYDRERRLDVALLQSGKFQEALAGVEKWLQDTEDMVANQKPPSADYKVVKAQLQEQKFLNKLLLDRQGSMSSLMTMGTEVMRNLQPYEQAQVEGQLKNLMHRFEDLITGAQERTDALERTIPVAHDFQEKLIPLAEWLEQTEKRLATMATVPIEREKLRQRIAEHGALHDDIMDHKEAFEELTELAQMLMSLVGDDEAQTVVERLQEITDHYAKIVEQSEHIGQLLSEAHEGIGSFLINFEDLMAWIDEMVSRLSRYQILSVYVEKLQEQLDELIELSEEIADHQKQVSEAVNSGQEMMKHASGDDVIRMKEKLDMLQVKFSDLTSKATDRLRQAQETLPVVQNFHSSHERLISWMNEAEKDLKTLETVGLRVQESTISRLETEIQEYRPLIETINHLGPQLCQMSPGDGATVIEGLISHDNRRFDTICEQVQRKAERIDLSKQRNVEVIGDIDEILDWFHEAEKQMLEAEPLIVDPDSLAALLKEQKILNDEVSSQKGRVRDILASAKKLMRESSSDDLAHIRDKADELKDVVNTVSALSADRLSALEQALPLAEHFFETHADISQWLDEMESEAELLETPALNAHQIKKLQDRNKGLLQSVNEHKPLLDKLNKTAIALKKLCSADEGDKVQAILDLDNNRYNSLKMALREWQDALDEALQATSQFSDKLDGMLNALSSTAEQLNNAEPISAHPEKIHEQICDNKAVLKDLDKRSSALEAVRRAADDVITKAGDSEEPAVRDIKKKLDRLSDLWDTIQKAARTRGRSLEDAMIAAEKFWDELNAVMKALTELQDNLNSQEPPAVEPNAIQQQKEVLQEIKQEIEQTKPEVDHCRLAGQGLMKLCGEPDKPEVKKHIEDLDSAWENVTSLYAKREQNLINAMEKAMNFHGILQNLLEFLDSAEEKFSDLGPLEQDIETVKEQINELKDFKQEVDPHMIEVEALNRQAQELMERTSPTQARTIREPLADINHRWDDLLKGIVDRQRELENALLRLGQFQHALDELLVWMSKTEKTLDDLRPVFGDPQIIEVELAKHKVLMNDIQAHQTSVDTLNRAGRQLIEANRGSEDASVTQNKLNNLNKKWQQLQDKSTERQNELEEALKEAQAFHQEVQDLLMWLSDIDGQLVTSKPVGGLPETAREQLNRFMELYNDLDGNRHKIEAVMQQGQDYLKRSNEGAATNLQHNLKTLKQRWDNVLNRANDRKIKLEIALREATEFHEALQEFVEWLTNAEKYMSNLKAVSRVMDAVMEQIEEHKAFQKDVGTHREVMLNLDKKGTHLKYFSQKQDVILIKNLLISVQHRWERVVSKAAERTRALDHGYKEAKEFHDAWVELTTWLDEAESNLDSITHIGNDPEKIKQLLAKHKEFQRALGSKQPNYDATMKNGRTLKEKAPKTDIPVLQDMMDELKNKWNNVCSKSVDRQQKLEEALLFSGQFKDAVQALIDWLDKAQTTLSEEQFLYGDLDTVMALVDQHKTFQDELNIRGNSMESVRRTARELLQSASVEDAEHIQSQMTLLDEKWEEVVQLSTNKKLLLEESLKQAERLHKAVHMLLEWLSDAEMKLRFAGPLPEDEETTRQQLSEHHCFMEEMTEQEVHKDNTISLAQEILQKCHPDGVSVIRHWITIIQSRWEEVFVWARQREQRLQDHLRSLRDIMDLLEELLAWLIGAEASLTALEAEPLPDDIPTLEQLIKDHQGFMDDMSKKQPDVERVTKAFSSKRQPHQQNQAPTREKGAKELPHKAGKGLLAPKTSTPGRQAVDPEIKHPKARELVEKWRNVWLLAMERQRRLQDKYNYLQELERIKNFDFDEWRKRFLAWMNNKKSRVMDLFRKIDRDNDGKVTREQFIEGILKSKFPTSRLEMERVAEIFDRNNDGFVDHKEYIDTLRPDREGRPETEAEKIQDEVQRQVAKCTCVHRFKVYQVGEGKYRFGDSQKLRLVRILRSTVMVRVGGGWVALDEFLVKNDPCRAKGRTNLELREQFILADGVSQSMTPFKPKPSPNSSQSSQSGGSSFIHSAGSIPSTGPITKVREKSERSVPMRQRRTSGPADTSSDYSGPSFSETDSFSARSARARATPTSNSRLTPGGPSSKSSSRAGSRPSSRPNSRPPSRAGSDLSAESVEAYRSSSRTPTGTARRRTPVTPRSASNARGGTPTATSKIPSIKRTPSFGSSSARSRTTDEDGRPIGRERWK